MKDYFGIVLEVIQIVLLLDLMKKIKKKLDLYTKIVVSYILIEIWGCHGFDW